MLIKLNERYFRMFYVELNKEEEEAVEEEDEIDKSIKAIHQSAQKLSGSIGQLATGSQKLADEEDQNLSPILGSLRRENVTVSIHTV